MNKEKDWGVVSHFALHADTLTSLKAACAIALTQHSAAKGWIVKEQSQTRIPQLFILWSGDKDIQKFLSPIDDPEELANIIWKWLRAEGTYNWSEHHDTDGDLEEGYIIENYECGGLYALFKVTPEYIIYGK